MSDVATEERLTTAPAASGGADGADAELIYLYSVIEPGTPAHKRVSPGELPGLFPDQPVFAVEADGLAAVVSRVPSALFLDEPLQELLADLPRLTPLVVRHQSVVSLVREGAPAVVPVSFGAIYRGTTSVEQALRDGAAQFRALLDRVRGRQEWGLKVVGDAELLREAAAERVDELHGLTEAAASAGPGRAYLLAKGRERALDLEVDRLVTESARAIMGPLAELSADVFTDGIDDRPGEARTLLLKAAFLVDNAAVDDFLRLAAELRDTYAAAGLALDFSGPWAPYSFVRVPAESGGGEGG